MLEKLNHSNPDKKPALNNEIMELNNIIAQGLVEGSKIAAQDRVLVVIDKTGDPQTDVEIEDVKNKVIKLCKAKGVAEIDELVQDWREDAARLSGGQNPEEVLKEQEEKIAKSTAILILDTGQNFAEILERVPENTKNDYYTKRRNTRRPIDEGKTRWTLTRYPTEEQAKKEGLTRENWTKWVKKAFQQDWPKITEEQKKLVEILNKAEKLTILANEGDSDEKRRTNLSLLLKKGEERMTFVNDTPLTVGANVPGAEVFSSPIIDSANGQVFVEKGNFRGKNIKNIFLKFENGRIIKASSDDLDSDKFINEIIETDEGAKYIGEIAFGGNPGLAEMLLSGIMPSDSFWSEKIGGTVHFAIGYAMEDKEKGWEDQNAHVYNGDQSAVHMDIVIPLILATGGGKVTVEWMENNKLKTKVILENGILHL